MQLPHPEHHLINRVGWLRAAVPVAGALSMAATAAICHPVGRAV